MSYPGFSIKEVYPKFEEAFPGIKTLVISKSGKRTANIRWEDTYPEQAVLNFAQVVLPEGTNIRVSRLLTLDGENYLRNKIVTEGDTIQLSTEVEVSPGVTTITAKKGDETRLIANAHVYCRVFTENQGTADEEFTSFVGADDLSDELEVSSAEAEAVAKLAEAGAFEVADVVTDVV